jgi:hypothetical protein
MPTATESKCLSDSVYISGQKVYRSTTEIYTLSPFGRPRLVDDFAEFARRDKNPLTRVIYQTVGLPPPSLPDFDSPLPWQHTSYATELLHGNPGRIREAVRLTQLFNHHLAGGVTTPPDNTRRLLGRRSNVARFASTSGLVSVWVDQSHQEVLTGTLPGRDYEDIGALVTRCDGAITQVVPGQKRPLGRLDRALFTQRHFTKRRTSTKGSALGGRVLDYPSAKHAQVRFVSSVAAVGVASFAAAHNVGKLETVVPVTTSGIWALTKTLLAKRTTDKNAIHFDFSSAPKSVAADLHAKSFDYLTKLWDTTPGVSPGFPAALTGTSHTPELERRLTDAFEACRRSIELRVSKAKTPTGVKLTPQQREPLMVELEYRVQGILATIPRALESGQPLDRRAAMLQYAGGAGALVASIELHGQA